MLGKTYIAFLLIITASNSLVSAQEIGVRYLIITHDNYYNVLKPLADWKTQKGLKAKIVRLSEIGSDSTQIRNYVINAYNTWQIQPEYLLLVGNKYQIPFPYFNYLGIISHSDNYYTNVTGDFHNEIIPGRFWVSDTIQAKTVVTKVLGYEKNPYVTDSLWFRKGVTIVNEYEPGGPSSAAVYWADARYAHQLMNNAGFIHIDSLAESFGHSGPDVVNAMNEGRSYFLYRGWGSGVWFAPFNNINIDNASNGHMLPVVISATCETVEGIGNSWLNAGTPAQPKGIVGFFGTTTIMGGAAEMRSALARGTLESIFCDSTSTLGKAAEAGRLRYYQLFGNLLEYNSWTCLGDPELNLLTFTPKNITVSTNSILRTGICTVSVHIEYNSTAVENALVCAMAAQDTTFYNYGRTNNAGNVIFIDTLNVAGDSVKITVTGRNLKTNISVIHVSATSEKEIDEQEYSTKTRMMVHPNPFNKQLNIDLYGLASDRANLKIYDIAGRCIKTLIDNSVIKTDKLRVKWDRSDDSGLPATAGIYFVRLITPKDVTTQKIILQN